MISIALQVCQLSGAPTALPAVDRCIVNAIGGASFLGNRRGLP
jgi:hypothetical protein